MGLIVELGFMIEKRVIGSEGFNRRRFWMSFTGMLWTIKAWILGFIDCGKWRNEGKIGKSKEGAAGNLDFELAAAREGFARQREIGFKPLWFLRGFTRS